MQHVMQSSATPLTAASTPSDTITPPVKSQSETSTKRSLMESEVGVTYYCNNWTESLLFNIMQMCSGDGFGSTAYRRGATAVSGSDSSGDFTVAQEALISTDQKYRAETGHTWAWDWKGFPAQEEAWNNFGTLTQLLRGLLVYKVLGESTTLANQMQPYEITSTVVGESKLFQDSLTSFLGYKHKDSKKAATGITA
ncbi:hypothetical protein M8C21_017614 [Ambrosia artemisiifolia]|uniref:Uncharacterized protein n=1 Tax=Ambrosia artemisiifolia TaxID=4212 RepID=A0AAD5CBJ0_AMBAR|nr:hypothetical protein M8C21_017614 [Ambrosia artemisiifolia]